MPRVVIDGVEYSPGASESRIGVAITTHNRTEVFNETLAAWHKNLPEGALLVVVDDASDKPAVVPDDVKLIRSDRNLGIAKAKNLCLATLMDAGCTDLFLVDDDVRPLVADWWKPYVESPEPHLMHGWGDLHFATEDLIGYIWPKGCFLYAERRVIERIGGMDPIFGKWGLEHVNWSDRIFNAGLTTCRYQDVPGSEKLLDSLDRKLVIESSVPLETRLIANVKAAEELRYSDAFVPYRETAEQSQGVALSILVPAVSSRRATFTPKIMDQLYGQLEALPGADQRKVEVLVLTDAKSMVLGDKRNAMVRMARGEYVAFVDDDDRVADDYLATLLEATKRGVDVITFNAMVSANEARPVLCRYSLSFAKDENVSGEYHRIPNHLSAVRRELALRTPFPALLKSEDSAYSGQLKHLLKTEHHVDEVLYFYDFNTTTTETQGQSRIDKTKAPEVDVVILSKASTDELRRMTEHAIATCLGGAGDHSVNVVAIEQVEGVRYSDAVTIHNPSKFAYNKFANQGIATGMAPWVMVANSDLEFTDGWLDGLLAAKAPLVSPVDPNEQRQRTLRQNESGYENGKHFSGWCFMMQRDLWERIGGLDEDFIFWCADDSVIEQVKAINVKPTVVPGAVVKHLISRTVGGRGHSANDPMDGELTWAMVHKFNAKYRQNKFPNDDRYLAWKKANGIS